MKQKRPLRVLHTLISNCRYLRAMSLDTTFSITSTGTRMLHSYPGHVISCTPPSCIFTFRYLLTFMYKINTKATTQRQQWAHLVTPVLRPCLVKSVNAHEKKKKRQKTKPAGECSWMKQVYSPWLEKNSVGLVKLFHVHQQGKRIIT